MGDNSNEDNLAQAPVLPVADLTDFNPAFPPATGAEYLLRVQMEAKKYPNIVTVRTCRHHAKRKPISSSSKGSSNVFMTEIFVKADPEICPAQSWADESIEAFMRVREKVTVAKTLLDNKFCENDLDKIPHIRAIPLWKDIILGKIEQEEESSKDKSGRKPEVKVICKSTGGKGPLLSIILQFPQSVVIDFLETLTTWVREYGWCHQLAVWTYSLLACLEIPLVSDTVSVIRDLSRVCSVIRSKHKTIEDKSLVTSLNLVICIVGRFFGQLDIMDGYVQDKPTPSSPLRSSASRARTSTATTGSRTKAPQMSVPLSSASSWTSDSTVTGLSVPGSSSSYSSTNDLEAINLPSTSSEP